MRTVAGCMRARGRYSNSRARDAAIRVRLGVIVLALPALFLSLTPSHSGSTVTDPTSSSDPSSSHHNIKDMVVRYACMACVGGPTYFTTYQHASIHYARSPRCNQSKRGIATIVLPNRPADTDAGGSGGAGVWAGPGNATGRRRQRPGSGSAGARHFIHVT